MYGKVESGCNVFVKKRSISLQITQKLETNRF